MNISNDINIDYQQKYLKYKIKYLNLLAQKGGKLSEDVIVQLVALIKERNLKNLTAFINSIDGINGILDLEGIAFDDDGLVFLAKALDNTAIHTLRIAKLWKINDGYMTNDGYAAFFAQLNSNTKLKTLTLDDIGIANYSPNEFIIKTLIPWLTTNQHITTLNFVRNGITLRDLAISTNALSKNTTLVTLNVSSNQIYNLHEYYGELVNVLLQNTGNLTTLNLSNNSIDDNDFKYLVQGLIQGTKLTTIDLSNNKITNDGIKILIDKQLEGVFKYFPNLILDGNQIDTPFRVFVQYLPDMLKNKKTVRFEQ